jgi:NADPH:quinone reductase-like Zn-dependent oxidoreductase
MIAGRRSLENGDDSERGHPMRALVADGHGGVQLTEVDDPKPRDDQAVGAVRATSQNRGEVRGLLAARAGALQGWDVAGDVVVAARDGSSPPAGTRVVGLVRTGAWAERVAVPSNALAALPDSVSYEDAATLPVAGVTAWRALQVPEVVDERAVLVTGASGGVGRFAVQLATHLGGYVTAVVGSEARGEGLRELGAEAVVVGMPEDGSFDVILESVGGASLGRAMHLVSPRGTVVTFGASDPSPVTFDPATFYRKGGARLYGLIVFEEVSHHRSADRDLGVLVEQLERGALRTQVDLVVGWERASEAFDALMQRRVKGKAVLRVGDHAA